MVSFYIHFICFAGFFFCFSSFFPFFTLLGPYLPLVDPSTPIPAPCTDSLKKQRVRGDKHKTRNDFFFCKFQMFSSFFSFSWFLPFFTILGPYLPLVNPPTPIPAPCLHPLRQQGVRGNQHKARNGLFDHKFCLYWSISLHQ